MRDNALAPVVQLWQHERAVRCGHCVKGTMLLDSDGDLRCLLCNRVGWYRPPPALKPLPTIECGDRLSAREEAVLWACLTTTPQLLSDILAAVRRELVVSNDRAGIYQQYLTDAVAAGHLVTTHRRGARGGFVNRKRVLYARPTENREEQQV